MLVLQERTFNRSDVFDEKESERQTNSQLDN